MTDHARIGPSSAHRTMGCPGSVALIASLPAAPSSRAANEGTAAHLMLSQCIAEDFDPASFHGETIVVEDMAFTVDDEMVEGVALALDVVDKYVDQGFTVEVEQRVQLDHLCPGQFGTSDVVLKNPNIGVLGILDFKYGRGVYVSAEGNPQLLCYLSGAHHEHHRNGNAFPISSMFTGIIQPRGGGDPVRIVDVFLNELHGFEADFAKAAALALTDEAPLAAGVHCDWCPAAGICPAFRDYAKDKVKIQLTSFSEDEVPSLKKRALKLSPAEVGEILREAVLIEDWIEAVRSAALQTALTTGVMPEGFKLVRKRTHRRWLDDDRTAAALRLLFELKDDQLYTRKIVSPAAAEKLIGRGGKDMLTPLWRYPPGDPTLAPLADKREALAVDAKVALEELKKSLQESVDNAAE